MMSLILSINLVVFVSYLLGSIPTAYLCGKIFKKIDIRQHGSGNVGATNAFRILGAKLGIVVLIIDIFKGYAAIMYAQFLYVNQGEWFFVLAGFMAIIGHIYTVFLGFKGGKGVATAAGVCAAIIPLPFFAALFSFAVVLFLTRYVSLSSLIAAAILLTSQIIAFKYTIDEIYMRELYRLIFVIIIVSFIVIKHIPNIKRLISGKENKLIFKKNK